MADSLQAQLAGNIRLRIGLAAVLAIVGVYFVLDKSEQVVKHQKEYRRASVQLAQARQQASDTSWLARSKEASKVLEEMREHDWIDNSNGLIQSKWNDYLQTLFNQEKVKNMSIALSETSAGKTESLAVKDDDNAQIPGTSVMKAKLNFEAVPSSLYKILNIIDTNQQSMIVEGFTYKWIGVTGRAELNLKALTHLSNRDAASSSSGSSSDVTGNVDQPAKTQKDKL